MALTDAAGPSPTAKPGQPPPFGSSPATGPTQNPGFGAQGVAGLALVVKLLERLVPLLGSHTPAGQDVLDTIKRIAKHVPPGAVNQAQENAQLQKLMLQRAQMQGMRPPGMGAPPGAGGPPGAPPGAGGPPGMPPGAGPMPPPGAGGPPPEAAAA